MSSNGEVHGAKLQRENTAPTAARFNEGSKTSISRSHEMKGKIVDVHPVAPPLQEKKKKKNVAVNTKDCVRETEGLKKRNERRIKPVKRVKGHKHQQQGDIKRKKNDEVRMGRQVGRYSGCFISRELLFWHEDNHLCLLIMDENECFTMSVILSAADSSHNSSLFSC